MKTSKKPGIILIYLAVVVIVVYLIATVDQAAPFLNAILMIGIPLIIGLIFARKLKVDMGLFGIGALTFIASQIFHIPFNQWLLNPFIERLNLQPASGNIDLAIIGLLFGLSAGVFEETARYIVYKRWLPRNRSWGEGLMFGIGHGGIEAVIFGLLALWGFLQLVTFRNLSPDALSAVLSPEKVELVQSYLVTYWGAPWYTNLLGTVERLGAMAIHLGATLMVLQAFNRKNIGWFFLAVLWHTLVDALAVFGIQTWNIFVVEGIVVIFGLCSLGIVFALRKQGQKPEREPEESKTESIPSPSPPLPNEADELTLENLEDSRYE
jgi:uncharacterized membrane protein YhfC